MKNDTMYHVDSAKFNHGGHELMDLHETLGAMIGGLDQCVLLRDRIQDNELRNIVDRQYKFALDDYNTLVEAFQTGKDPSQPTGHYEMTENNKFTFGVQPGQPKKPITQANEINDEIISGFILSWHKGLATLKATAATETTNPVVRRVLADSIPNCIEMAYEISIYQNRKGYYQVPQLSSQDTVIITNCYAPATTGTTHQSSQFN
ncbi:spore coat protein [Rummeliibacillus sp. TYF005]|nr:spore coat protein [Rummeliibacillus sp. TYF005]RPJ95759.1 spore coat protein [Rummeliibacillus sp. TYF005]